MSYSKLKKKSPQSATPAVPSANGTILFIRSWCTQPCRRRAPSFSPLRYRNTKINGSPPTSQPAYPGGRQTLWESFSRRGVPETTIETIISSVTQSTITQYSSTYRLWWNFCTQEKIPIFEARNIDVLRFLQKVTDEHKYQYGAVNSHRSALSLILPNDLGTDPLVKRFMKGISRLRPAQPRYTYTWDPQRLFSYLETLPDNLNLLQLSQKVVSLLALITGGRLQTISLIRLSNIREEMDTIQINITDPIKTSGVNNEQPTLHIPSFKEKPCLCVATTLKAYIAATKDIRKKARISSFLRLKNRTRLLKSKL
ncbi:uncharacterized protein LOC116162701 [Photinus pyralis]|uniref:uncharacterized protein LOC116162701 n=1 Tax=Photinus pyralis TaxID=7054 RepID=UPI0012675D49|nr:uncharacterized protein LOC116162701 [Photinus pyralis]